MKFSRDKLLFQENIGIEIDPNIIQLILLCLVLRNSNALWGKRANDIKSCLNHDELAVGVTKEI